MGAVVGSIGAIRPVSRRREGRAIPLHQGIGLDELGGAGAQRPDRLFQLSGALAGRRRLELPGLGAGCGSMRRAGSRQLRARPGAAGLRHPQQHLPDFLTSFMWCDG